MSSNNLPEDWRRYDPYHPATQVIGIQFLLAGRAAALKVPSTISPEECNYNLNPARAKAEGLTVVSHKPYNFDERLLKV